MLFVLGIEFAYTISMKTFIFLPLLLSTLFTSTYAGLGTTPVEYSCDEMYHAFYYDLEKVRQLYDKFQNSSSSCNEQVFNWIKDPDTNFEQTGYRSAMPDTIENKAEMLELMKTMLNLDSDLTVEDIQDPNKFQAIINSNHGLPSIITEEEMQEKIEFERGRREFFKMSQSMIQPSLTNVGVGLFSEELWRTPNLGQGAGSTGANGFYRIDRIGYPASLDQAYAMKCSDIYRGLPSAACENDCLYLRNILVDMHSKYKLWNQEWDWENDKMICTPQASVKGAMVPFDASYCKLSCAGGEVPCSTCNVKVNEGDQMMPITCASELDAAHAASLYCFLNSGDPNCAEISCNTTYNNHAYSPEVNGGKHEQNFDSQTSHSVGVKIEKGGEFIGSELTGTGEIQFEITIDKNLNIYSNESTVLVEKYFTEREDGKLFECTQDDFESRKEMDCQYLDELMVNKDGYPHPLKVSSCLVGGEEKNPSFSKCQSMQMGEGRAFYTCGAQLAEIEGYAAGIDAGVGFDIGIGPKLKVIGNTTHGFNFSESFATTSKRFNAGGLTLKQMESSCERWQDQWFNITFKSHVDDRVIDAILTPENFFSTDEYEMENDFKGIRCSIKNENQDWEVVDFADITAKIGYGQTKSQFVDHNTDEIRERISHHKVMMLSFDIDKRLYGKRAPFYDWYLEDISYPYFTSPEQKKFFSVPFVNRHAHFVSAIHEGNASVEILQELMDSVTPLVDEDGHEIKNCEVFEIQRNGPIGPGPMMISP